MTSNATPCSNWRLYVIVDRAACGTKDPADLAARAIRGGADVIQWRDKSATSRSLLETARRLLAVTRPAGIPLIINDRVDVAHAAQADGVHLGQEDLPLQAARQILGPGRLIGQSTHSLEQATRAEQEGADYIGVGPIFATPTKPDYPQVGLSLIREVSSRVRVPCVCIGGIDADNASRVMEAGGQRVAVVRAVCAADDPEEAAKALKRLVTIPVAALLAVCLMLPLGRPAWALDSGGSKRDRAAWDKLNIEFTTLHNRRRYAEAEKVARDAIDLARTAFGPVSPQYAVSLSNLAVDMESQGRYSELEPILKQALDINERALGPKDLEVAKSLTNLAGLYAYQQAYAKAEPLYQRSLAIREAALKPDDLLIARSLSDLASLYRSMGKPAEAIPLYKRAVAVWQTSHGEDPQMLFLLDAYADLLRDENESRKADSIDALATKIRQKRDAALQTR